jgi:selenocysteine-specific elongation factor
VHVIATAGHVDHGKSTLVRALTGMEPDRWAEERRRGMTIDLGYAWTRLPSTAEVAFVDVPGHERFAANMLAGVGPVPAVMLVVAADGGWAAQTEDHVRALDALGVRHGLVAVTRSDLADPAAALVEAGERLAGTSLADAPVVAVSAVSGEGLDELRGRLDGLVAGLPRPNPGARVRLWIDRCFTIRGAGTVVTGTLPAGTIRPGDTLELGGRPVTVRALQALGEPVAAVAGTARVAVNLRGVAHQDVRRGDALLTPGAWQPTTVVDVRAHGAHIPRQLVVHVGSAAVAATIRPLGEEPGSPILRLQLGAALPLQVGDRVLLRDPGRRTVVAGATVLDPAPPPLRRRGAARARARALTDDDGAPNLGRELARRGAVPLELLRALGVPGDAPLDGEAVAAGSWLVERATWNGWRQLLEAVVDRRPRSSPLDAGVGRAELLHALALPHDQLLAPLLADCPDVVEEAGRVRRRGATVALRPDVAAAVGRLEQRLRPRPFAAPEQAELVGLGLGHRELGAAVAANAILRLPGDVVLLPDAPARAATCLQGIAQPFTLSAARQALATTRRVAVPLLEHMDRLRLTERVDEGLRRLRA